MNNELSYLNPVMNVNPEIASLRVFEFSFSNKFQDKILDITSEERVLIEKCIIYKSKRQLGFWKAILRFIQLGYSVSDRMLAHCVFHNENKEYKTFLRDDFLSYITSDISGSVALNSKVTLSDGSEMHIVMLDFKTPVGAFGLEIVKRVLAVFSLRGAILDSGKSYHFIGYDLVSEHALINILAKFIMMDPVSDKAWAAHQIIERSASLRISRKYGKSPVFIEQVDFT